MPSSIQPTDAPVLIRLGGVPSADVEAFASDLASSWVAERLRLERELSEAREELVDRLYEAIHAAPRERRRFLLTVKRDCFNGRDLGRHRRDPRWQEVAEAAPEAVRRLAEGEGRLARWELDFDRAYRRAAELGSRRLAQAIDLARLSRGIALGSPLLVSSLPRLRRATEGPSGRKERRLELALLRYWSRAAVKLSPYSTLTRVGLGWVRETDPEAGTGLRLVGHSWDERSFVRCKRYILDQYLEVLERHPAVRDRLEVTVNNTARREPSGSLRLLRPGYWDMDPADGTFHYFLDSFVSMQASPSLASILRRASDPDVRTYGELVADLSREVAGGLEEARRQVDLLIRAGALRLVFPWPDHEAHLERRIVELLRDRPLAGTPASRCLARMVELEESYATSPSPGREIRALDRLVDETWDAVRPLGGIPEGVPCLRTKKGSFYEDVFVRSADGDGRVAELPLAAAGDLVSTFAPLYRLASLFAPVHEWLHTLAGLVLERNGGCEPVPLLGLFSACQPVWREFMRFEVASRQHPGDRDPFNPLGLPEIDELHRLRATLWPRLRTCSRRGGGASFVPGAELAALAEEVPDRYAPHVGPALFVQQADPEGTLWVLNRMKEGTGRLASRFTPLMDDAVRHGYTSRVAAGGDLLIGGERALFLDVMSVQGDTLNVHAVQTPLVLDTPGGRLDTPARRRRGLRELRVEVDQTSSLPVLRDGAGRRVLPVHLGGAGHDFIPALMKFLCYFGPGDVELPLPGVGGETRNGITSTDRLSLGRLVVQRRTWSFDPDALPPEALTGPSETEAFVALSRWRIDNGIPERAFLRLEQARRSSNSLYKPQYVDFSSPHFFRLFQATASQASGRLHLEEMLPDFAAYPRDREGRRWAAEILLDSITLGGLVRPPSREPAVPRLAAL